MAQVGINKAKISNVDMPVTSVGTKKQSASLKTNEAEAEEVCKNSSDTHDELVHYVCLLYTSPSPRD